MARTHFLDPLLKPGTSSSFELQIERTGATLASTLLPAFDRHTRNQGLLGRDGLPRDTALILAPCQSVHTFFMRFPIDIVFVRKDGTVVKLRSSVGAWRLSGSLKAFAVVELAAGVADERGLKAGDRLVVAAHPQLR